MSRDNDCVVNLQAALDLNNVHQLGEELIAATSQSGDLVIEAADVDRIGTPAIQVLVAAAFEAEREGRRVQFSRSEALETAFSDLGLSKQFAQWSSE